MFVRVHGLVQKPRAFDTGIVKLRGNFKFAEQNCEDLIPASCQTGVRSEKGCRSPDSAFLIKMPKGTHGITAGPPSQRTQCTSEGSSHGKGQAKVLKEIQRCGE